MRIHNLRNWLNHAVNQGYERARKVGHAIGKRMRNSGTAIDAGVGVGQDEAAFTGRGGRVWLEVLDEYRQKILEMFERSVFERFPRMERFVRRWIGRSLVRRAPQLPPPKRKRPTGPLGAHTPIRNEEAERLREQIERARQEAHTREGAGLRERHERRRRGEDDMPEE